MFEPLGEEPNDKHGSGRAMRIIGIAIGVIAVVLLIFSFA